MKKGPKSLSVGFLYDDSLDKTDGVSQYVKTVGAWLSSQGHTVSYFVGESDIKSWHGAPVYSLAKNLRVAFAGNRLSTPLLPKLNLFRQAIRGNKLDVMHVQVPYSPLMAQILIKYLEPRTALVGTVHIYPAHKAAHIGTRLLKIVYGKSFKRIGELLSVSTAAQAFCKSAFNADSIIIPNVVDLSSFRASNVQKHSSGRHIVFLGRLVKRKGVWELLEAFNLLLKTMPDAQLTIAGDGPLRTDLESRVNKLGIKGQVTFLGFVSENDKPKILAAADIACFPSLFGESFGIVLIEAMAAGAGVVVGGNNPGYISVLGQRPETIFDPRDTAHFSAMLENFLNNRALYNDIHAWQSEYVAEYDIKSVGPKIVDIYEHAIAKVRQNVDN